MTKEEAIKWLEETKLGGRIMHDDTVIQVCDMAISAIKEQEERRWISCKEELPSNKQKVIFYCKSSDTVYTGRFNYVGKYGTVWFRTGRASCSYGGSHWMPLPEPPKEVTEGTE